MGYQMRAYLSMRGGDYGEAMLSKNPLGRVDIHVRQKLFPKDVWMHYELNVADPELWWSATTMNFKTKVEMGSRLLSRTESAPVPFSIREWNTFARVEL